MPLLIFSAPKYSTMTQDLPQSTWNY